MGNIKNVQPKRHCPHQYSTATGNSYFKLYAQLMTGGRGRLITATELHCRNTREMCGYVGKEKECPKYPL